jgi:hypothetical protein
MKNNFMKKISLVSLMFVTAVSVNAQDRPMGTSSTPTLRTEMSVTPRFGLKGGVNLATLEIDDDSQSNPLETNNKTSFNAGVFVNIPLGGTLRFQPEVVYSRQGSKIQFQESNAPLPGTTTQNTELDLHYLNVPLMLQVQTAGGFFVEAGPQIGFLLTAKDEDSDDDNIKDLFKKTDFGAGLGLGYLSRVGLGLNARYAMGFSNVFAGGPGNDTDEAKYKNRVLSFGLVYHFGANK